MFASWKFSQKLGGSCGTQGKPTVASSQPFASQRSPLSISGRKTSFREKVGVFSPLEETQQGNKHLGWAGNFDKAEWNL